MEGRGIHHLRERTAQTLRRVSTEMAAGCHTMAGEQFLLRMRAGLPTQAHVEPPVRGEAIRAMCADGTNLWLGTYYSALLKFDGTAQRFNNASS